MSDANLGWLFYKGYFRDIDLQDIDRQKIDKMIQERVDTLVRDSVRKVEEEEDLGNTHFTAITTYPGLILGTGYLHELPNVEGQAILGFDFDYTTGLPIIRGSSIKGVIRGAFKHPEYIKEIIEDNDIDTNLLEQDIFIYNDIFFDAQIRGDGKILEDDFITPHGENPLKNPKLLRFIKVAPNIEFVFHFELHDGVISKVEKQKLFQVILEDLGLGAKTNVGYGKFDKFKPFKTLIEKREEEQRDKEYKEQERVKKEHEEKKNKAQKEQKAEDGINNLNSCKSIEEAFKLLKDSFGKIPKPTLEQKKKIQAFYDKQNNMSKKDEKVFKKYLK